MLELQRQAAERSDVLGLAGGLPADDLLPRRELTHALETVMPAHADALQYSWPEGISQLRAWIADRLVRRGARIDPERVIVTAGAQQALAIVGARFHDQSIAVGDVTYPAALEAFRQAGARVVTEGGDVQYAIADVSNPRGVATQMPATGTVIVDEAYVGLRFDGAQSRPLLADAPQRVWHIGTVSKTIAPGLRVGWLIAPEAEHEAALAHKQAADLQTATMSQQVLARALEHLDFDALLARARAGYRARAERFAEGLRRHAPEVSFVLPEGGFSIWVETDRTGDELALLETALAEGVMFDPGNPFRPSPSPRLAMRLSYSHVAPEQLDEAARRVARTLGRAR